jgi:hypothetical protein
VRTAAEFTTQAADLVSELRPESVWEVLCPARAILQTSTTFISKAFAPLPNGCPGEVHLTGDFCLAEACLDAKNELEPARRSELGITMGH